MGQFDQRNRLSTQKKAIGLFHFAKSATMGAQHPTGGMFLQNKPRKNQEDQLAAFDIRSEMRDSFFDMTV